MAELFSAAPGTVFELESVRLDAARKLAGQILQEDSFRSIGLHHGNMLDPRAGELLSGLGGLTLPIERPLTVNDEGAVQTVIGFDVIKGMDRPDTGTVYHRPAATDAKNPESPELLDKSFVHVPLDAPLTIDIAPARRLAVDPGQAFLSLEGEDYDVRVAPAALAVEFVLAAGEVEVGSAWNRYVRQQPNPTI